MVAGLYGSVLWLCWSACRWGACIELHWPSLPRRDVLKGRASSAVIPAQLYPQLSLCASKSVGGLGHLAQPADHLEVQVLLLAQRPVLRPPLSLAAHSHVAHDVWGVPTPSLVGA